MPPSTAGLGKLKKLEKLNLFSNELTESGIDLGENKQLLYIDLSDNAIESIDFFWCTTSFVHINLANNRIRTLDPLRNNANLEHLNVSGNRFATPPVQQIGSYADSQLRRSVCCHSPLICRPPPPWKARTL